MWKKVQCGMSRQSIVWYDNVDYGRGLKLHYKGTGYEALLILQLTRYGH